MSKVWTRLEKQQLLTSYLHVVPTGTANGDSTVYAAQKLWHATLLSDPRSRHDPSTQRMKSSRPAYTSSPWRLFRQHQQVFLVLSCWYASRNRWLAVYLDSSASYPQNCSNETRGLDLICPALRSIERPTLEDQSWRQHRSFICMAIECRRVCSFSGR
jgi:hypothetical protein